MKKLIYPVYPGVVLLLLLVIFQSCETEDATVQPCPEPFFVLADGNASDDIVAIAEFDNMEQLTYSWLVNDTLILTNNSADILQNDRLEYKASEAGTYTVCLVIEDTDCGQVVQYCEDVIIDELPDEPVAECPEIWFSSVENPENVYKFVADSIILDGRPYVWIVDKDTIEYENVDSLSTDHTFEWQLGLLERKVCIATIDDECGLLTYCEDITPGFGEACPELAFEVKNADGRTIVFEADFPSIDELQWFGWYVDGEFIEDDGVFNNGDNTFTYTFDGSGEYKVCIATETPECGRGASFCLDVAVE